MTDSCTQNFRDEQRGKVPTLEELTLPNEKSKNRPFGSSSTIVIDFGSYECRAGFAHFKDPSLVFKNLAYTRKGRGNDMDVTLVGHDIENLEAVRSQLKSSFDKNVVTQFDTQEVICDYIFSKLGVKSQEKVDHPIFISEPIANPNHCRKFMSELMFECYGVPGLSYFTDSMAAWYHDRSTAAGSGNGVIVSIGYQTSHIAPVIDGLMDLANARRISMGGYHLDYFMQRLLQLKYPIHASAITLSRSEEIVQNYSWIAANYQDSCNSWLDINFYESKLKKLQLPYANVPANFAAVAIQGEIQVERSKLLKEKQTLERLEDKLHIYDQLCEIRELSGTKLYNRLAELGVDSLGELQCHIKAVQAATEDLKRKITYKDEYNQGVLSVKSLQEKIDKLDNPALSGNLASFDVAEYYQLHVGLEQTRVAELLFQPSMMGMEQGGISETLIYVLKKYPEEIQSELAQNVMLTGGCACIPGLKERVECDLKSNRPFQSPINVRLSKDPVLGSWKGARKWLKGCDKNISITKAQYNELGGEYFIEHQLSNKFYATPTVTLS